MHEKYKRSKQNITAKAKSGKWWRKVYPHLLVRPPSTTTVQSLHHHRRPNLRVFPDDSPQLSPVDQSIKAPALTQV